MRILVSDDNRDDRWLAIRELRKGFPAAEYIEIDDAAAFHAAAGQQFDLVVSDYSMGWMDGLEVLRASKAVRPDVPVIMLTGTGGENVAVEAMREGVDDYLLKRDVGKLAVAARRALERATSRAEARHAQERYRDLFRNVPVGLGICQPDGEVIEANTSLLRLLGASEPARDGKLMLLDFFDAEHRGVWDTAIAGEAPEVCLKRPDGSLAWVVLRVRAVEVQGERRFECAMTDLTSVKQAQRDRGALLEELYHRVNNNLQLLTAFVTSLSAQTTDPVMHQGLEDLANRIQSISIIQGRLYKSGDFERVNLREFLVELLQSLLQGSAIQLTTEMEDVVVPVSWAVPVGLIANELLINALKHAFSGIEAPALTVRLARTAAGAVLAVEDNGVGITPAAEPPGRGGYGTRLLRSLARQAHATLETRSHPGAGTSATLSFPTT